MYEGFSDYQSDGGASAAVAFDGVETDEDDSPFLWLHRDAALGAQGPNDGGGGSQLGTSDLWLIKEDDALEALQTGILLMEDLLVFSGVCIWEKGDLGLCGGGLREQVDVLQSLEVVLACNDHGDDDVMESLWNILSTRQRVLAQDSLEGNIEAAIDAWKLCSDDTLAPSPSDQDAARERLADAALKAWVGVNLLEDPLGTLVEVKNVNT